MPSASRELQSQMLAWFGSIDSNGPEAFLESRGYVLTRGWEWRLPVPAHTLRDEEILCIKFLMQEWDYGSLTAKTDKPRDDDRTGV